MTLMRPPPTGDLVRDLERYMANERELGVWSYPHFVRYLRAMIYKLTPQPHRCTLAVLDAAAEVLADGRPGLLQKLMTTPPHNESPAHVSREAANAICEVICLWGNWDVINRAKTRDAEIAYQKAKGHVHEVELAALRYGGLTMDDLCQCAVAANSDTEIDVNRHDAALAAMTAGHFKLAHEIATSTNKGEN
jgi:hypothetical protein